jgi:hypothetical protein
MLQQETSFFPLLFHQIFHILNALNYIDNIKGFRNFLPANCVKFFKFFVYA